MIDEGSRHRLHLRLDDVLGPDEANVLMEFLPPGGWADVVTKQDIQSLRTDMDSIAYRLTAAIREENQKVIFSMMGFFIALAGLLVAAVKLL